MEIHSDKIHSSDNGRKRLYGVAVYNWSVLFAFLPSETVFMDDSETNNEQWRIAS